MNKYNPRSRRLKVVGGAVVPKAVQNRLRDTNITQKSNMGKIIKRNPPKEKVLINRPIKLTSILNKVTTIDVPERGSFNAGLAKFPGRDEYICVYRPNEYRFIACILNKDLSIKPGLYFKFSMTNCADPRLIWLPDNRLLMAYSSTSEVGLKYECIRGSIIMDLNVSENFIDGKPFRISAEGMPTRQKNWMPFEYDGSIYFVGNVCPHTIYRLNVNGDNFSTELVYENQWVNPWMFKEPLRGNTNIIQLDDGNYLGTFHTATWHHGRCYYDNGCYIFEGKPPFRVLKCANRTYLKAEDAIAPHFRKRGVIVCTFPVGMVREGERLLISYGDNDSLVKVMETTVGEMKNLMLDIY